VNGWHRSARLTRFSSIEALLELLQSCGGLQHGAASGPNTVSKDVLLGVIDVSNEAVETR